MRPVMPPSGKTYEDFKPIRRVGIGSDIRMYERQSTPIMPSYERQSTPNMPSPSYEMQSTPIYR